MKRADKTMAALLVVLVVAWLVMLACAIYLGLKMLEAADEGDTAHVIAYAAILVILFMSGSTRSKS